MLNIGEAQTILPLLLFPISPQRKVDRPGEETRIFGISKKRAGERERERIKINTLQREEALVLPFPRYASYTNAAVR